MSYAIYSATSGGSSAITVDLQIAQQELIIAQAELAIAGTNAKISVIKSAPLFAFGMDPQQAQKLVQIATFESEIAKENLKKVSAEANIVALRALPKPKPVVVYTPPAAASYAHLSAAAAMPLYLATATAAALPLRAHRPATAVLPTGAALNAQALLAQHANPHSIHGKSAHGHVPMGRRY